jgi:hypothetical protein
MGAAGSGKSEVAAKIATWEDYLILDKYIESLVNEINIAIEGNNWYFTNLLIMAHREIHERKLLKRGKNFITVGTVFDTLAYQGEVADQAVENAENVTNELTLGKMHRESHATIVAGFFAQDSFLAPGGLKYDTLIFCESDEGSDEIMELVIEKYQLQELNFIRLSGTTQEKLNQLDLHREIFNGSD